MALTTANNEKKKMKINARRYYAEERNNINPDNGCLFIDTVGGAQFNVLSQMRLLRYSI
jgi:hypothetical protein